MKKFIIPFFIAIFIIIGCVGIYMGVKSGKIAPPQTSFNQPVVFSDNRMLLELWSTYKKNILEPNTLRTLDKSQNNITTSEGQSYTMMRAVWMDDMPTFDKVWQWTKDNMQRSDKLISWKFGDTGGGHYGIQTTAGGQNTATDADVDIAYALIMASNQWKDSKYLYDAQAMIKSIWEKEVVTIAHKPVLTANDIERLDASSVLINPSYFAPYAYRVFAKVDPTNDWMGLVDNSYNLLFATAASPLDKSHSSGLTPNWARVDRQTGAVTAAPANDSNYGYDAFRTPWRLTLDWKYYHEPRAKQVLQKYTTLSDSWSKNGKLDAIYSHDGQVVSTDSVPASYGANLGYFIITNPTQAKAIYESKLLTLYSPDTQSWKTPLGYYDDNWAWFGMALYQNQLPNIAGEYEK
ncbi:MAG: glycosyl hydrolase family 8 [Candidatus Saccharimonadales bacterium]